MQSSQPIEKWITSLSPKVGQWLTPAFSGIDSGRVWLARYINQGLTWAQTQSTSKVQPRVSSQAQQVVGWAHTASIIATTILVYVLSAARYLIITVDAFYIAAVLIIFYILWRLFRRRYPRY